METSLVCPKGQPVPCVDEFEYEIVFETENPGKIKKYFKD